MGTESRVIDTSVGLRECDSPSKKTAKVSLRDKLLAKFNRAKLSAVGMFFSLKALGLATIQRIGR